jgi:hypothetical protein
MKKLSSMIISVCLCMTGMRAASAAPPENWVISANSACEGLTASWTPTLANLQLMVGQHWTPAPGPVPGHGVLLLFAVACPQSHIAKKPTGAFTIGAVIVPVEPPEDTHGIKLTNGHGWAVITDVLGPETSPVMQLFKRHGFAVTDAKVTLRMHKAKEDNEPTVSIVTQAGHMGVHAQVTGPAKRFDIVSALAGNNPSRFSLFTGPESASRQEQGTAIVTAGGDTLVSRFDMAQKPGKVMFDRDFTWAFRFSDQPY